MLQTRFTQLLIFFLTLVFSSCKDKDETTLEAEINPSQLKGVWYDSCGAYYPRHLMSNGEYLVPPQVNLRMSWKVSKNRLIISTYHAGATKDEILLINYIDAETILFANGKKWYKCSDNPAGFIDAQIGNFFYSLVLSRHPHSYFDPSNSQLFLIKEYGFFGPAYTINISPIDTGSIALPYIVPSANFTMTFSGYSSIGPNSTQFMALEITGLNNNIVEGNFSGKMYRPAGTYYPADTMDVTEGKFKVPLNKR